jgi:hypothetical protein
MSTSIIIDGNTRSYEEAADPNYAKQLDRGDTKVAVAPVTAGTALTLVGTSHALKTHAKAGPNGRRTVFSIKDECVKTDGTSKRDTVVVTVYHNYNDEDAIERCVQIFAGQYAYLSANDFAELRKQMRGSINFA